MVDVLDADRALAHARAAGHAVPHGLVQDGVRDQRLPSKVPAVPAAAGQHLVALAVELVAEPHHHELGRQVLAGGERGARVLAAAALGAGHPVDHLLPGQVPDRARPEPDLVLGDVRVVEPQRLQAARARASAEEHVDRRDQRVEVLGVRDVEQEARGSGSRGPRRRRARGPRSPAAVRQEARRPTSRSGDHSAGYSLIAQRDARPVPDEQREGDGGLEQQDVVGDLLEAAAHEPDGPLPEPDREGDAHADQRRPARTGPPGARTSPARPATGCVQWGLIGAQERHHDRGQQDQEAPEQQQVHEPGDRAQEQLGLRQDAGDLARCATRHLVEPGGCAAEPDEPRTGRATRRTNNPTKIAEDREEQDPRDEGPGVHAR